ncbi:hypothetical protein HXX76_001586 [Chlamydomonas incerta]|uniref:Protein kinase domain-containing protein n=1 Tax=Chlamydomonas incerta TaxID=51695 RepID=A0A836B1C6_CHLIN|nr:hypothetical protein HXX76_001586 [Chlamydomonas incerta]|eukprot:KAG2444845.1 hypothetical protein HXX76_001586 [Chlamydomonas incerta]
MPHSILGEVLGALCCCWPTPGAGREGTSRDLKRLSDWRGHPTLRQYDLEKHVADGGFSEIWLARHRGTGAPVCLKVVNLRKPGLRPEDAEVLRGEARYLRNLDHPSLLRCSDVFETKYHMVMILEYLTGGEMLDHLHRVEHYSEMEAGRLFAQVMSAVAYMHNLNIVHRDIKPENVMFARPVDDCAAAGKPLRVKLIDLGMAAVLPSDAPGAPELDGGRSLQRRQAASKAKAGGKGKAGQSRIVPLTGVLGSPGFIAPEVVAGAQHSFAMDVYSLGVMLFVMLTGRKPWGMREVRSLEYARHRIANAPGLQDPSFRSLSAEAKDLLLRMLADDPRARPTAAAVMRHPFIARALAAAAKPGGRGGEDLQPRLDEVVKRRMLQLASLRRFRGLAFAMMSSPQEGQQLSEFMKGVAERRKALHRDLVSRAKTRRAVDKQRMSMETLQLQAQAQAQEQLELQKQRSQRLQEAAAAAGRTPAPTGTRPAAAPASRQHSIDSAGSQQPLLIRQQAASSSCAGPAPRSMSSSGAPPPVQYGSPGNSAGMLRGRRMSLESSRLSVDSRNGSGSLRPLLRSFEIAGPPAALGPHQHRLPSHHPAHPPLPYGAAPAPGPHAAAAARLHPAAPGAVAGTFGAPAAPWGSPSGHPPPALHGAQHAHAAFPHHVLEPVAEPGEPASGTESTMTGAAGMAAAAGSGGGNGASAAAADQRHTPAGGLSVALAAGGSTVARPPLPPQAHPHPQSQPQARQQAPPAQPGHTTAAAHSGGGGAAAKAKAVVDGAGANGKAKRSGGGGGKGGSELELAALDPLALIRELPPAPGNGGAAVNGAGHAGRVKGVILGRSHSAPESSAAAAASAAVLEGLGGARGVGAAGGMAIPGGGAGAADGVTAWLEQLALGADMRAFSANSWTLDLLANEALLAALTGVELNGRLASSSLGDGAAGTSLHDSTVYSSMLYGGYGHGSGAAGGGGGDGPAAAASTNVAELAGMLGSGDMIGSGAADGSAGDTPGPGTAAATRAASAAGAGRAGSGWSAGAAGAGQAAAITAAGAEAGAAAAAAAAAAVGAGSAGAAASARAVAAAAALRRLYSGIAAASRTGSAGLDTTVHAASQAAAALLAAANAAAANHAAAPSSTPPAAAAHAAARPFTRRISEASSSGPVSAASGSLALQGMASEGAPGSRRASIGSQQPTAGGSIPRAAAALAAALGTGRAVGSGAGDGGGGVGAGPARLRPSRMSFDSVVSAAHLAPGGGRGAAGIAPGAAGANWLAAGGGAPRRPIMASIQDPSGDTAAQGGAPVAGATWVPPTRAGRPSWTGAAPASYGSGGITSPFTTGHSHRHSFGALSQLQHGSGAGGLAPQPGADAEALGAGWSPSVAPTLQQQRPRLLSGAGSGRLLPESSAAMSTVRDGEGYLNITLQRAPSFGAAWPQSGAMGLPDARARLGSLADTLGYGSGGTPVTAASGLPVSRDADSPARFEPLPLLNTRRLLLQQEEHTEPSSPAAGAPWGVPRGAPGWRRRDVSASPAAAMAAVTTAAATIAGAGGPAAEGLLTADVESGAEMPAVASLPGTLPPFARAAGMGLGNASAAAGTLAPTLDRSGAGAARVRAAAGGATAAINVPFASSQWRRASLEAAVHATRRISTEYSVSPASMAPTPSTGVAALPPYRSPRPSRYAEADGGDTSVRLGRAAPSMGDRWLLERTEEDQEAEPYLVADSNAAAYQDRDLEQDPMITFSPSPFFNAGSLAAVSELDEQSPLPLRAFLAPRPSLSLALPHADEVMAAERAALEETLHGGSLWMLHMVGGRRAAPAGSAAAVATAVAAAAAAARSGALSGISGGLSGAMSGGVECGARPPAGPPAAGLEGRAAHSEAATATAAASDAKRRQTQSRQRTYAGAPLPPAAAEAGHLVLLAGPEDLDLPPTWPSASISPAAVRPAAPASRPRAIPITAEHGVDHGHAHGSTGAAPLHTRPAAAAHALAAPSAHHAVDSPRAVGTHHLLLNGGSGGGGGFGSYGSAAGTAPDSPRAAVPHSSRTHQHSPMRAVRRRPTVATASSSEQHGGGDSSTHGGGGGDSSAHGGSVQDATTLAGETLTAPRRGPHVSDSFYTMVRPTPGHHRAGAAPHPQSHLSPPQMHRWHSPFEAAAKEALPEWDGTIASAAVGWRGGGAPPVQAHAAAAATSRLAVAPAGTGAGHLPASASAASQVRAQAQTQAGRVCGSPTRWHSPFEAYAAAPMPAAPAADDLQRRPQRRG